MKTIRIMSVLLLVAGIARLQGMEQKFPIQKLPQEIRLEVCKNLKSSRTRYIDIVAFFKALQIWRCVCKEWNTIANSTQIQDLCNQLKKLIAQNSKRDEYGKTPLHTKINIFASPVQKAQLRERLIQLLEAGANINKGDMEGETPLCAAALFNQTELVQILLRYDADINKADNDGWTPLHKAAKYGWKDMVKLLIAHGADVTKKTAYGKTVFALAIERNYTEIAKLLTEAEKEQEKKQQATTEPNESKLQKVMKLTKSIFGKK